MGRRLTHELILYRVWLMALGVGAALTALLSITRVSALPLAFYFLGMWDARHGVAPCENAIVARLPSPDGAWEAVLDQSICPVGLGGASIVAGVNLVSTRDPARTAVLLGVDTGGHPDLAHAWAKRGADLRVQAPGQARKVAVLGGLDGITRLALVHTSPTKRSSGFVALLERLDRVRGVPAGALPPECARTRRRLCCATMMPGCGGCSARRCPVPRSCFTRPCASIPRCGRPAASARARSTRTSRTRRFAAWSVRNGACGTGAGQGAGARSRSYAAEQSVSPCVTWLASAASSNAQASCWATSNATRTPWCTTLPGADEAGRSRPCSWKARSKRSWPGA